MVAVFEWGWGGGNLGIEPGPIEPFIPRMPFAKVFGVSMIVEPDLSPQISKESEVIELGPLSRLRAKARDLTRLSSPTREAVLSSPRGPAMTLLSIPRRSGGGGFDSRHRCIASAGADRHVETGLLRLDQGRVGLLMVNDAGLIADDVSYSPIVHNRYAGALAIEVDHFVRCVRGDVEPVCTAADGTEAVRISLAMETAAASGQPATMSTELSVGRA